MRHVRYLIGLDLGQAQDYSALTVVEELDNQPSDEYARQLSAERRLWGHRRPEPLAVHYHVRHLERLPLGTAYPKVVERARDVLDYVRGAELVVDATGVGRPVVDMFREAGLRPVPVLITAGDTPNRVEGFWRVPKRDLIGCLQVLLQSGRLKIAEGLRDAHTLVEEMLRFRVRINTRTGHDSYGAWREGEHDDLVLALAVACWRAERQPRYRLSDWMNSGVC